jgi:ATP-binding cassette subfamily B protein/subfamily B ATP-binding cassette protein MsbA
MAAADLLRPWPLKLVLDHVLLQQPVPGGLAPLSALLAWGPGPALVVCAAGIVAVALVTGAFAYYQVHFTTAVGNRLVRDLRRELFAHLQRLSLSFHTRTASGELLTTVASDTAALRDTFTEGVLTLGLHALTIAGIFALMWWMNWRLALVVTATLPLLGWNLVQLYTRTRARAAAQRKTQAAMASRLHEVFASLPMVQAFGRERHEHQRFETQNEADLAESVQAARLDALSARSVELIGAVATAVVVGAGALEVLAGRLSVGALLVFTSYLHGLYRPMRTLAKLSARFAKARVSAGRIADILGTAPELDDRPDAIGVERLAGDVVFDRVSFAYEPGRPVLQDVSFHVRPGQRVAVVGPSGAGKSTLVSLLLRLYAPTGGRILVDGVDIAAYRRESLRQAMAVVLQHTVLFGASIRENIAYGKLDATDADVREAARRAGADDFIQALPRGYDTVVGERGATLSGGQRQRLSIARAMIRPASILLLDEPMTGLDHRTETAVHDALARAAAGRTALLVTHDLATAASADLVLVLDGGRLVDAGTHEALIGRCALYRHLHRGAGARDGEAVPA